MVEKMVIAWDLDGTLIDSSHRIKFKDNGEFDLDYWIKSANSELVYEDKLLPLSEVFFEFQKTGFTQICVTARNLTSYDYEFLRRHGFQFDLILHREDSLELDHVLKTKKLKDFFEKDGLIPFQAYDDKEENLAVFDKYGFRTFNAAYLNKALVLDSYEELTFKPKDIKG